MRKQTLLMILAGLVLAGPAWGEPFEDGKRAYLRGDDRQARVLLRQAVKERPRDPLRREWLAKVYDRLLQPLEALIERDMAAKIRAGSGYRPQRQPRSRIRITQFDVVGMGPVRQSVNQPGKVPGVTPSAAPVVRNEAQSEKFAVALNPASEGSGFEIRVTALGSDGESRISAVRSVLVTLETASGGTYQVALDGKSGSRDGASLLLVRNDTRIRSQGEDGGQPLTKAKVAVQVTGEPDAVSTLDIGGMGLFYVRPSSSSGIEPPRLPG